MGKRNLIRHFAEKLALAVLTIFVVATFNFFLIRFMPGDPLEHLVGEEDYLYLTSAHPEVLEKLEVEYGLGRQPVGAVHQLSGADASRGSGPVLPEQGAGYLTRSSSGWAAPSGCCCRPSPCRLWLASSWEPRRAGGPGAAWIGGSPGCP